MTNIYQIQKRNDGWYVLDQDGYDVSYATYETKKEAIEAFKTLKYEQAQIGVEISL